MARAAGVHSLHVEDDVKEPDRLTYDAVVAMAKVPLTAAVTPDAESVTLKDTVPEPPATASSSAFCEFDQDFHYFSPA